MKLRVGTLVEYKDGHVVDSKANGRRARIVRQCSKQGGTRQYIVEVASCPADWPERHVAQQVGRLQGWWDVDFVVIEPAPAVDGERRTA